MSKVLVSGSTGFIGSAFVKACAGRYNIVGMGSADGEISEPKTWHKFETENIFNVVHLAGKSFVPQSWQTPEDFYRVNVQGTVQALEFCRRKKASLTFLSSYVYGTPSSLPISERAGLSANNPYAHTKILSEQLCEFYHQKFGVSVTVLRPFNIFGPGQSQDFLIPKIVFQALNADEIEINDLRPKRDYVYIDDLVSAILLTLDRDEKFGVYNIGSGSSLSVAQIIEIVQSQAGTSKRIVSQKLERENEILDVVADIGAAKLNLDWCPQISFEDGIRRILKTLGANRNQVGN